MKKIIFVLMFSLGLVSAENIDAVCGENKKYMSDFEDGRISELVVEIVDNTAYDMSNKKQNEAIMKLYNQLHSLIYSQHSKEFKIDNKESICAYMNVSDLSFLNTQLTQDDIEQFERYMAQKGWYEGYEDDKELYLQMLKFFKYYHKYIPSYKTAAYSFGAIISKIQNLIKQDNIGIALDRYVYGTFQGSYSERNLSFDDFKEKVTKKTACSEATANSKEELVECAKNKKILPPILKWAESNMKQSKPKDSK